MKQKVKGPFTEQDVAAWNQALSECERVRAECELAQAAGFPCEDSLAVCTALRDQLMAMKSTYAPGIP